MTSENAAAVDALDAAIRSRRSVRAFRPDPVPKRLLTEIIDTARATPSNFNSQPWSVHLLVGKAKQALGEAMAQAHESSSDGPYSPFPKPMPGNCEARISDFGRRYYSALGIERSDMTARSRQTGRNYVFFGAPVGMIFTIHSAMTKHSWLDCGLFLQTIILAAQVRGLATCPQVSFVRFQSIIADHLGLGPEELVTCGMSCGYEDEAASVNRLDIPREPLETISRWHGFDK